MPGRIDFIELPCTDTGVLQDFYASVFDLAFTAFGPTYACTLTGDVDLGFQADPEEVTAAPLPVIQVADLDSALTAVTAAGGTLTRPIFAFPGGRRFHFRDPAGNELAAHKPE
jgi:predicted enzyme related to lactoylglutathione lyase